MRYRPKTKYNRDLYEVVSALQKSLRRGDATLAGLFALELHESGYGNYLWKRLLTVSAEDVFDLVTKEVLALFEAWKLLKDDRFPKKGRVCISKAVLILARAGKSRDADHLNYAYDNGLLDPEATSIIDRLIEAREEAAELPEYALDVHTTRGKRAGKTKKDFFRDEDAALKPKAQGEFDFLLPRITNID